MNIASNLHKKTIVICAVLLMAIMPLAITQNASAHPKGMLFPVLGGGTFSNDYDAYRSLNGVHRATDIFAPKHTPVVAAVDGVIEWIEYPEPSWGWGLSIRDADDFSYWYLHLNNDNIGTDDGRGGAMNAYAPNITRGSVVKRGQLLGYLGDSGNAENTPPHLHLEIVKNQTDERINPYPYLREAQIPTRVNKNYPALSGEILPYGPDINAHVSIDSGTFAESKKGIVTGTGVGYAPHVRIMDEKGSTISGFYAYNPSIFAAGVDVATGDVDGDGVDEIITGTLKGAPHVRILRTDGTELGGFYAYDSKFEGGVHVSSVDIDGDGKDEILVGPGLGTQPVVKVFKVDGTEVLRFNAYSSGFHGGVDVSSGDLVGDTREEIVTVPGPGGSAHLRIFSADGVPHGNGFNAYEAYTGYTGGARLSVGNVVTRQPYGTKDEILVGPRLNGGPHFRLLDATGRSIKEGYYYEQWWSGNYDVAASEGKSYVSTGVNRRSSIHLGPSL